MKKNLEKTRGLVYSQEVLLALIKKGMKREDAYRVVQERAMKAWENGSDFRELISASEDVNKILSQAEIDELFDPRRSLNYVDYIFERTGLN